MDWRSRADWRALEQLCALLVALAGLAERAALLPALLPWHARACLGCAEARARTFLVELAWWSGAPFYALAAAMASIDDAETLAERFRALVRLLGAIRAWVRHPARNFAAASAGPPAASDTPPRRPAGALWSPPAPPAPDTS